jgi:hypothetical protein
MQPQHLIQSHMYNFLVAPTTGNSIKPVVVFVVAVFIAEKHILVFG